MKRARKLITFILAAVMVMSMSLTAMADELSPHTIQISNASANYVYDAYQIFVGDYADGKLSDIEWGSGVNGNNLLEALKLAEIDDDNDEETPKIKPFDNCQYASDVAEVLAGYAEKDNNVAKAFADIVSNHLIAVAGSSENEEYVDEKYSIDVIGDGYYLVKNRSISGENSSYTRYMLQVTDNVTLEHKGTYATVTKEIGTTSGDGAAVNEASIGESIDYVITGTVPENIDDYNEYYYVFTDTLSAGLTYNDSPALTVKIGENDVTRYFYVNASKDNTTKETTLKVGMDNLLQLENLTPAIDITKDTKIVINYSATLNEDAVIAEGGNDNEVVLDYSNDPNNSGTGTDEEPSTSPTEPTPEDPTGNTPTQEVTTYVTKLTITKVDGDNGNALLPGATFRITGEYIDETATVDGGSATLTFSGLGAGTYTLTETVTPDGYNTISPIEFTINFESNTLKFSSNNDAIVLDEVNNVFTATIANYSGSQLPSTGGIGTTIFYIVGGVLVVFAVVLLVTKKRMKNEE